MPKGTKSIDKVDLRDYYVATRNKQEGKSMKKFEVGRKYQTRSIGDHDCIFEIMVTSRTQKTVSYLYNGKQRRSSIKVDADGEWIRPDNYSMAPVFRAHRETA